MDADVLQNSIHLFRDEQLLPLPSYSQVNVINFIKKGHFRSCSLIACKLVEDCFLVCVDRRKIPRINAGNICSYKPLICWNLSYSFLKDCLAPFQMLYCDNGLIMVKLGFNTETIRLGLGKQHVLVYLVLSPTNMARSVLVTCQKCLLTQRWP